MLLNGEGASSHDSNGHAATSSSSSSSSGSGNAAASSLSHAGCPFRPPGKQQQRQQPDQQGQQQQQPNQQLVAPLVAGDRNSNSSSTSSTSTGTASTTTSSSSSSSNSTTTNTTAINSSSSAVSSSNGSSSGNTGSSNNISASSDLLARVLSSGGRGEPRAVGEAVGKMLLIGEVRLDRSLPGWIYKVSVNGERLPPKATPKWTVWLEVPAGGTITLEVLARDTRSTTTRNPHENEPSSSSSSAAAAPPPPPPVAPAVVAATAAEGKTDGFVSLESKTIQPLHFFKVSAVDVAVATVPVGWRRCPDMAVVLEMRLEADASRGGAGGAVFGPGTLSTRSCEVRKQVKVLSRVESAHRRAVLFPQDGTATTPATPLTDVEVVIVKDSYNKVLAWLDIMLEFIVERLFFLVPSLPETLGDLTPNLQRYLHGIIDLAVRSLDPSTEDISRESYQAVHPNPSRAHQAIGGYTQALAEQGFLLTHWEVVRDLWMDSLRSSPYMEAYELQNMELGTESALYRFFTQHVLTPAVAAINAMDKVYEDSSNAKLLATSWLPYSNNPNAKWALGVEVYARLFSRHPEIVPLFRCADMDSLSKHLSDLLQIVAMSFGDMWTMMPAIRQLGAAHADLGLPSSAHAKLSEVLMEVLGEKLEGFSSCSAATATTTAAPGGVEGECLKLRRLWGQAWQRTAMQVRLPMVNAERLVSKAYEWIEQASHELSWDEGYTKTRKGAIYNEVMNRGTYSHTAEELVHGARVCWRNSAKCIGRIAWNTLMVRDKRHVTDLDEVFAECMEHQRLAMGDGSIKSVMTVFRPQAPGERMGTRFWSPQLTRYAAYAMSDGSVMGDKANLALTQAVVDNGWVSPEPKGQFDVLPIVLETDNGEIRMFDVPPDCVREVPLEHPDHPEFAKLGLKWGAVPSITNFTMNLGGIDYTACPFNGWFMNTELARDLMEDGRCGRSHDIAKSFGITVSDTDPFWKDRTFLELNYAVVHSFRKDGASIVDHHTASQQFMTHDLREKREGRECPAQWSWIVPPLGGSLTQVFHHEMRHFNKDPRFVYQAEPYAVKRSTHSPVSSSAAELGKVARKRVLVLYGSETGTAEGYAYQTADRLRSFACHVSPLDRMELSELTAPDVHAVLVVMSTFGDGGMPNGAKGFHEKAKGRSPGALTGVRYSLMALGSSAYPDFCKAGKTMDTLWQRLGATPLAKIQLGNELQGQAKSVRDWQNLLDPVLGVGPATVTVAGPVKGKKAAAKGGVRFLEADCKEVKRAMKHKENFVRKGYVLCPLVSNEELLRPATETRSTRLVEIDLARHPKLTYLTGDHASVLPSNHPVLVERTLKWIGAKHSQWLTVTGNGRPLFPVPTTIARAFVHELDLSTREPIAPLVNLLLQRASKDSDKRRLESLLEKEDEDCWAKTQTAFLNKHTTVLSVLKEFPSARLSAEDLIVTLPLMKPRHYSISSASEVQPRQMNLTVGVLKVETPGLKTIREGLCSNFLSRQKPGELIRVAVRSSEFRSPADLSNCPVIMVGTGTGISPMVGFLQARAEALRQGTTLAPCHVYFGCRDSTEFLYSEQLRQWHTDRVITALHVAMSREGEKTYVQHLIGQQPSSVWELLSKPDCHTYVCGDSSMGEEVKAEMMMVALRCSSMDRLGVIEYFKAMKSEGRLQSDTWGVGLHGAAAVDTFLSQQHAQGQWQAQVEAAKTLASESKNSSISSNGNGSSSGSGSSSNSNSNSNSSSNSSSNSRSNNYDDSSNRSSNKSNSSSNNNSSSNSNRSSSSNISSSSSSSSSSSNNNSNNNTSINRTSNSTNRGSDSDRRSSSIRNVINNYNNSNSTDNYSRADNNTTYNSNAKATNNGSHNSNNNHTATNVHTVSHNGNSSNGDNGGNGGSLGRLVSMARGVEPFRRRREASSTSTAILSPCTPPTSTMVVPVAAAARGEAAAAAEVATAGWWLEAGTE